MRPALACSAAAWAVSIAVCTHLPPSISADHHSCAASSSPTVEKASAVECGKCGSEPGVDYDGGDFLPRAGDACPVWWTSLGGVGECKAAPGEPAAVLGSQQVKLPLRHHSVLAPPHAGGTPLGAQLESELQVLAS